MVVNVCLLVWVAMLVPLGFVFMSSDTPYYPLQHYADENGLTGYRVAFVTPDSPRTAASYKDPAGPHRYYTFTGQEQDTIWLSVGNERTLSVSTLRSGVYYLYLQETEGFRQNNYRERILTLVVQQPYYEKAWFRLLALLIIIICITVYIRLRTGYMKRRNQVLESSVAARTELLALSEKKLRRQTQMQERLITAITHDLKTPMKYLAMLAGNLLWKEREGLGPELVKEATRAIYDTSCRMYYLMENLIYYIKTHARTGVVKSEEIDLHEMLEEKIDIFSDIARERSTVIMNQASPPLEFRTSEQVLGVVVHNLLDNAVKYTNNGVIRLSASQCKDRVTITVEDTGEGLPPQLLEWINNYSYANGEEEATELPPSLDGIGLIIVMELLALINGKLTVINKPDKGAIVKLELQALQPAG